MSTRRVLNIIGVCFFVIVLPMLNSCKTIMSFVRDGKVVAEVGTEKLYDTELAAVIPDGISAEDSTRLALQYIKSWATDMVFNDVVDRELSKSEKNVTKELEDYRRSLLKYRYEQKYINQRLDTAVTDGQIEKYYEDHIENFRLTLPIAKAKFLCISCDSPNLNIIKKKLLSANVDDIMQGDSLTYSSALRYNFFGGGWVNMVRLSREFGTDYGSLLAVMKDGMVEIPDGSGNLNIAFISEMMRAGQTGPVEYYREQIKDILLSTRKQALISGLERDLLENARAQGAFVIK